MKITNNLEIVIHKKGTRRPKWVQVANNFKVRRVRL